MIRNPLTNRSVLVTGGTGSFGKVYVRHALESGARRIAVFSRDEDKQETFRRELDAGDRVRWLIGSVTNLERLMDAMRGVELVVHAAALKQVPTAELHPWEATDTNITGSRNVARAAIHAGVLRAVFLSTDKAAGPNTLYGGTKFVAEREWIRSNVYAAGTPTRLMATRYGNVLGSRGSVVPLFRQQAQTGQLTITHPDMTRFWMRIDQAVELVNLALACGRGGEVFIPKVPAANILTLAHAVAPNVPLTVTGIRRGEKLHETLITADEARDCWEHDGHYHLEPDRTWEYLPPPDGTPVAPDFEYRSDTNPQQLTVEELRDLLADRTLGSPKEVA
jgi:UDP-N-acetylglucosamine 4,6-dehydratase